MPEGIPEASRDIPESPKESRNPEIFSNPDISVRLWPALLAGCQTQQVVACKERIIFCKVLQEERV